MRIMADISILRATEIAPIGVSAILIFTGRPNMTKKKAKASKPKVKIPSKAKSSKPQVKEESSTIASVPEIESTCGGSYGIPENYCGGY
jgi:hypothetical protein